MTHAQASQETFTVDEAYAHRLDRADPLSHLRDGFHIPNGPDGAPAAYFTGNSLGLQPKRTREALLLELDDWARLGVDGHRSATHPWETYHEALREPMARIVGAAPAEVVVMNSLTVNLHLLMVSFYRPTTERFRIVIEDAAFPSDSYAVASQAKFHGHDPAEAIVRLQPREGEHTLREEDIEDLLQREGKSVALVMLGGVNYLTGQFFDIERITRAGHAAGAVVGWDLAHAAGNVPLRLHDWGADFAAWCSYKYLNSGAGSASGVFIHSKHTDGAGAGSLPRFEGWWGSDHATRFKMAPDFTPAPGADAWQLSNSPIFAIAPIRESLAVFDEVTLRALRDRSLRLTAYLWSYVEAINAAHPGSYDVLTPADPERRGCQLSIVAACASDPKAARATLQHAGCVCDFREPNVIRAAPVPLYTSFHDVWRLGRAMEELISA